MKQKILAWFSLISLLLITCYAVRYQAFLLNTCDEENSNKCTFPNHVHHTVLFVTLCSSIILIISLGPFTPLQPTLETSEEMWAAAYAQPDFMNASPIRALHVKHLLKVPPAPEF